MFDQLLNTLNQTIKQAKTTARQTDLQFKATMQEFGINHQQRYFHNPTQSYGKAHSFGCSQRFKSLEKEEAKTTDSFYQTSQILRNKDSKGAVFLRAERFGKDKEDQQMVINPSYQLVKPNNKKAPIYTKPDNQLQKSKMSIFTTASQSDLGPAKYFINESIIKRPQKTVAFSKQKRFIANKPTYEGVPLYPNENQTKKRPPSAAILKPKLKKNKKLISLEKQEELRERLKLVYWKSIPLEYDRLLRRNVNGPVIRENYFDLRKLSGTERRCAILMYLERMNYERGGLDLNIGKDISKDTGCQVVYRKSTPKPFKFSQMHPGPDYYYPKDDIVKPQTIGYTFAKQQQKKPEPDNRDYQINESIFKKGGNIIINPQHQVHKLTEQEIRNINRGPGYYDCLFGQVERRNDIGVVKFAEINEKNARQNNCVEIKEVNDAMYFVKYDAIDANTPAPLYKEPANVRPQHTPDKQMFPEHWLFYDGDLKKVRAQIAKNVLIAQGMDFNQYKLYAQKFKAFKRYLEDRRKQPEVGEYTVNYNQLDAHIQGFQMQKQPQKTLIEPIIKEQFDVDGDNLILEPQKPKPKLADIKFIKQTGREQEEHDPDFIKQGDRLILNPKKPEKHVAQIDFEKQVTRPQIKAQKNQDEPPMQGDALVIDPKLPQKKIANIQFSKQSQRPEIKTKAEQDDPAQNIINPDKPKKIKGFVEMKRMTAARLVPVLRKNRENKKLEEGNQ